MLWLLAVLGTFWADVPWTERVGGLGGFHKLLIVPVLLGQFRETKNGTWVLVAYLMSCAALLFLSAIFFVWPALSWQWARYPGVPVKEYISQSLEFVLCAFALLYAVFVAMRDARNVLGLALLALALLFLADVAYVYPSRTALVVVPLLVVLLFERQFGPRFIAGGIITVIVLAAVAWSLSPNMQNRVQEVAQELAEYRAHNAANSSGVRVEFWRKSVEILAKAPLIGHGTGSIAGMFRRSVFGTTGASAVVASNPHQQTLAIAIQFGLMGVAVLWAMWITHAALFWNEGLTAWIGLVVVVQNIVSSLFNTPLFDFSSGWTYVFGVGVAGGIVLGRTTEAAAREGLKSAVDPDACAALSVPIPKR
jgi:hypothetical protein